MNRLYTSVVSVLLVCLSASVHEFAHALAAHKLGDDTAKEQGRLTLNPLAHIDVFGSLILPILMSVSGGPVFAYARPVPYNPNRLRNPRRDEALVALAGPVSNLLQAILGTCLAKVIVSLAQDLPLTLYSLYYYLTSIVIAYVSVNLVLMFFNLIPVPPLDGSKLVMPFMSSDMRKSYYAFQRYAVATLLVVMYLLPRLLGFDLLGSYLGITAGRLYSLFMSFVFR